MDTRQLAHLDTPYLVRTGETQSVEHRDENVCWNEEAQNVGAADEPVLSTVSVDLRWYADDRYRRLEGGDERQRNRETVHASVCHEELLSGALAPPRHSVVEPDGHGGDQQDGEYHIVHPCKIHVLGQAHADCLRVPAAAGEGSDLLRCTVRRAPTLRTHQSEEACSLERH